MEDFLKLFMLCAILFQVTLINLKTEKPIELPQKEYVVVYDTLGYDSLYVITRYKEEKHLRIP